LSLFALTWLALPTMGAEPLSGWKEQSGTLSIASQAGGAEVLTWQFDYGKEPAVLMREADASLKSAVAIAFPMRSDRDGRLFLRVDQEDRKIFTTHFDVTREWRQISCTFADFQPFGTTTGKIDPARIDRIYLVDLNGSDGGQRGTRTVLQKELIFHKTAVAVGTPDSLFPLVAFDADGRVLDLKGFEARGTSGGRWCYLSDAQGAAISVKIVEQPATVDKAEVMVPTLVIESATPATLVILYWPVGSEYKICLQVNGSGEGLRKALLGGVVPVNLELARTRHRLLSTYAGGDKGRLAGPLQRIAEELKQAAAEPSMRKQAAEADRLLLEMLNLSRDAVLATAKAAVDAQLAPGPEETVPTPKADLLPPGSRVTVHLEDPAFRIGMGQGFGFVTKKASPETVDRYYTELRQEGFNMVTLPLYWDQIVDEDGNYTKWQDTLRFDTLARLGYTLHAHGFVQAGMPAHVRSLKGDDFLRAAKKHTAKLAIDFQRRYGDKIILWQAINEPASNSFGGSTAVQRIGMVSDLIGHMRQVIPGAKVVVNDYDWERGVEAERPMSLRTITGTIPFYRKLMKAAQRPDVLAVEWYPGARVNRPEFRVDIAEPCMDLLDASLYWDRFIAMGRPLIFTESNFPGSMESTDRNGYAWGRWTPKTQAQAAEDTFLLALSKPQIMGWVWWSITDDEPWNPEGGLFTAGANRKPVLEKLADAIASLKKPQTFTVATAGKLPLPRLPGTWQINVEGGASWIVIRDRSGKLALMTGTDRLGSPSF
jgi:hypothetical protein